MTDTTAETIAAVSLSADRALTAGGLSIALLPDAETTKDAPATEL